MRLRPRKQFGQHWLRSDRVLHQIIKAATLRPDDFILEIGPGMGVLTRQLLPLVAGVIAVEIDRDLCQKLRQNFIDVHHFLLIEGDILAVDVSAEIAAFPQFQRPNKVVANIPYNITGPILEKLLGTIAHPNPQPFQQMVLLVQKEVADRLCAKAGSRAFGALSVRVQYLADCEQICSVPAQAFFPPPKVDSAVVRLTPRPPSPAAHNPRLLDQLVKLGFATKRKMLRNNLTSVVDRDRLIPLLESLNINPQARAEDLSVAAWVALSNALSEDNTVGE